MTPQAPPPPGYPPHPGYPQQQGGYPGYPQPPYPGEPPPKKGLSTLAIVFISIGGVLFVLLAIFVFIGVYGLRKYAQHSKTAEATRSLRDIEQGAKSAFERETDESGIGSGPFVHKFCDSTLPTPARIPAAAKVKVTPGPNGYDQAGWKCLMFEVYSPQYYQYTYTSNGLTGAAARCTVVAHGDLDGDGVSSTYTLELKGTDLGEAERASMTVEKEDE